MTEVTSAPEATITARSRVGFAFVGFAVGIVAGVMGLVPWLIGGGILPLQNLWATETLPNDMPFVLLPVSQYAVITVFVLILVGGVFAGLTMHLLARRRSFLAWPAAIGLLIVHAYAVAQSFTVVANGLDNGRRSALYFVGMLGGAVVAMLLAQTAFWLASRRSTGPVALAIGLSAVPFVVWIRQIVVAVSGPSGMPMPITELLRWLPALIVGVTLVWCGLRPARRLAVWLVVLVALWVIPALFTTIQYGLGMRVLNGDLSEMASASSQVLPLALREEVLPALLALALGVVGVIVREAVQRRKPSQPITNEPMKAE